MKEPLDELLVQACAAQQRADLAALEQLERLIALAQDEIVYRAAPLSEILALLKARRDMPGLYTCSNAYFDPERGLRCPCCPTRCSMPF